MTLEAGATADKEDPELVRLISAALETLGQGGTPDLDELCRERPDLRDDLAAAIDMARRLPLLQRAAGAYDPLLGRTLKGRYRLVERIGAGAMGVVYRGEDLELQRSVAVKLLQTQLLDGAQAVARFLREAESLAAVHDSAVVIVYDRGETDDGLMFLVMELLEGVSLSSLLTVDGADEDTSPTDGTQAMARVLGPDAALDDSLVRQSVRWMRDLARGLASVHAAGVLHRDIKPSNIFIRSNGTPALIDFGIAARTEQDTIASREGTVGTPAYMAPEQLRPETPTHAIDIYGLAATLYHALTRRAPYRGTPSQVIHALSRHEPPPAYKLRPGMPRDLQAILDKAMAREPKDRYASADAFAKDLDAFLAYRPVTARPLSATTRMLRRLSRSREARSGLLVAVLLVGGIGVWSFMEARQRTRAKAWTDVWAEVPPTLVWCTDRELPEPYREQAANLLDRVVDLSPEPVPSRVIRGMFRLDHGDAAGAAADMASIAKHLRTPYANALADRYRELPADAKGAAAVNLEGLPTPTSPQGHYVAALHVLRTPDKSATEREGAALPLLQRAAISCFYAESLALLTRVGQVRDDKTLSDIERRVAYREIERLVIRLEERIGRATAGTLHVRGFALGGQESWFEAISVIEEGIALAPLDHALRMNASLEFIELRDIPAAVRHLDAAIAMRPRSVKAHELLITARIEDDDFETALALVDATPYPDTPQADKRRVRFRCRALMRRALFNLEDDPPAARQDAHTAKNELDRIGWRGDDWIISFAIASDRTDALAGIYLDKLTDTPLDRGDIEDLATVLPDALDADLATKLRQFLHSLSQNLAQTAQPPPSADTAATATTAESK